MKIDLETPFDDAFGRDADFELTVRSFNILKREGCNTVGDFLNVTHQDLDSYRNMTAGCIIEIAEMQIKVTAAVNYDIRQALAEFLENEVGPQGIEHDEAALFVADMLLARFKIEAK